MIDCSLKPQTDFFTYKINGIELMLRNFFENY